MAKHAHRPNSWKFAASIFILMQIAARVGNAEEVSVTTEAETAPEEQSSEDASPKVQEGIPKASKDQIIKDQQEQIQVLQSKLEDVEARIDDIEFGQFAEGADMDTGPSLDIFGFFDTSFYKFFVQDNVLLNGILNENPFFTVQHLNLYLHSQLSESFSFTTEIRFTFLPRGQDTYGFMDFSQYERQDVMAVDAANSEHVWLGGIVIERAHLTWKPSDYFGLIAGRFVTPFGIWNVDHGSPVIIPMRLPFTIIHGYIPLAQTGLEAFGRAFISENMFFDWAITLSNGRNPIESLEDTDKNKGLGVRARLSYEGTDLHMAFGGYGYWGDYTDYEKIIQSVNPFHLAVINTTKYTEWVGSLDFLLEAFGLRIQAEFVYAYIDYKIHEERAPIQGQGFQPSYMRNDFYALIAYKLPLDRWLKGMSISPFFFYEYLNFDDSVPSLWGNIYTAGFNFKPKPFLVFKGEYGYTKLDIQEFHYFGFQAAVAF